MSKGDLKRVTVSDIIAAQDQALKTKYHVTKILCTETDSLSGGKAAGTWC
jgi:hypothetical protein